MFEDIARSLTYDQRKALRRIGRGKSIPGRLLRDPITQLCFEWAPAGGYNPTHPKITEFGSKLLGTLESLGDQNE